MKLNNIIRQNFKCSYSTKSNVRIFKSKKLPESRFNDVEIQMLPRSLYQQIFKKSPINQSDAEFVKKYLYFINLIMCNIYNILICFILRLKTELNKFGVELDKSPKFENVDLKLPKLKGNDLIEHFYNIAKEQVGPYEQLICSILKCQVPTRPKTWSFDQGKFVKY